MVFASKTQTLIPANINAFTVIRPSRIPCSENGKSNFHAKKKSKLYVEKYKFCTPKMQTLHPKTALKGSPIILSSENANTALVIEIPFSENANFAFKNCSGALMRLPRILCSENGNFELKKWKFHAQK